jgi:hypothetical protein
MRKIKVFNLNKEGKIEFTKEELEKLLNETYEDGYCEGKSHTYTWTTPYYDQGITLLNNDMSTTDSTNNLKATI